MQRYLFYQSCEIFNNIFTTHLSLVKNCYYYYICTYIFFLLLQSTILKQFFSILFVLVASLIYSQYESDYEKATSHMGIICSGVTILFFAAPLASLLHVIKVKSSESLPFPIILSTFIVSIQWFLYGLIIHDKFVQVILKLILYFSYQFLLKPSKRN